MGSRHVGKFTAAHIIEHGTAAHDHEAVCEVMLPAQGLPMLDDELLATAGLRPAGWYIVYISGVLTLDQTQDCGSTTTTMFHLVCRTCAHNFTADRWQCHGVYPEQHLRLWIWNGDGHN
jgi:hypothetical protein